MRARSEPRDVELRAGAVEDFNAEVWVPEDRHTVRPVPDLKMSGIGPT
jgi:hypothetical protein